MDELCTVLDTSLDENIQIASVADNGFIQLSFLSSKIRVFYMTNSNNYLSELSAPMAETIVEHSNRRKIKLLHTPPLLPFYLQKFIYGNPLESPLLTFKRALVTNRFLIAKEIWQSLKEADMEEARVCIFSYYNDNNVKYCASDKTFPSKSYILPLYSTSMISLLNAMGVAKGYTLLLMHMFPRFLMMGMAADFIYVPTMLERPDWCWPEFVQSGALEQLNGTLAETFTEFTDDESATSNGVMCTFYHISLEGARLLATIFCSLDVMVQHEETSQMAWVLRVSLSYPLTNSHNRRTTMRVLPSAQLKPRLFTKADITYLKERVQFHNCNETYINYEFYTRPLLEIIARQSGKTVPVVEMLPNTTVSGGTCLMRFYCYDTAKAHYYASIFCTSRIVAMLFHGVLELHDISDSRLVPGVPQAAVQEPLIFRLSATATEKFRFITNKESQYLRELRWKDKRMAFLVAARIRGGRQFHVLKLVAMFL